MLRAALEVLLWGAAAYALLALLVFVFQAKLVYFPAPWRDASTPDTAGLAYETAWIKTEDGQRLMAWWLPNRAGTVTALFLHGNAGHMGDRIETLKILHGMGMRVLIFDYRGYGASSGRPTERGTYLDAAAAWRYVTEVRGVSPRDIVIHGRSLGAAVAAWLAREHPPAALVLESTFTSVPDLGAEAYPFLPVRRLSRIRYPTLQRLPEIHCPILVMHSPQDEIIPFHHGRTLYERAPEPKAFVALHGAHGDGFLQSGSAYRAGLESFLRSHIPAFSGH